jgi:hypothetical protein
MQNWSWNCSGGGGFDTKPSLDLISAVDMRLKIGVEPLQWVQCEFSRSGSRVSLLWAFVTPLFTSFLSLFFFLHDLWWWLLNHFCLCFFAWPLVGLEGSTLFLHWLSTTTFQRPASFWSLLVPCRLSQVVLSFSMSRFLPQTSNLSRFWSLSQVLLCLGFFSSKFNLEEVWI